MGYSMADAGPILKEEFDKRVVPAISKRNTTFSWFISKVEKVDINDNGFKFSVKIRRNQGYGSLTAAQSGGLLPRAGKPKYQKVRADYLDHFVSGELDGRVWDASDKTALLNLSKDSMADAEESFTTFQDFYLFGNGSGSLGVVTTGYSSGSPTVLTFALAQATPYGSLMLQPTQRVHFINPSTGAQRTGGSVSVSTVVSKDVATDVVTFDAVPTDVVANDIVVIEDTYGRETQGFDFHLNDSNANWLKDDLTGSALSKAANPWAKGNVYNAASAALSPEMIDTIALQTLNQEGDGKLRWDAVLLSHAAQQNQYRKLGYALDRVVNVTGNKRLDLGFAEVSHNGMEWRTSSHCQADRILGLTLSNWLIAAVKMPQMYNFPGIGSVIPKPGSDRWYDAAQFAVYARYNVICRNPSTQFLMKNLAFNAADVRRNVN